MTVVRSAGFYIPRSKDGFARTIPVTSKTLPPINELVVIKTAESSAGHVLVARWDGAKLISGIDSYNPGRVVDLAVYRGYI